MDANNFFTQLIDSNNKTKYQEYIVELGIDKVKILVPLVESKEFEKQAKIIQPESRKALKKLIDQYNGLLEEVN